MNEKKYCVFRFYVLDIISVGIGFASAEITAGLEATKEMSALTKTVIKLTWDLSTTYIMTKMRNEINGKEEFDTWDWVNLGAVAVGDILRGIKQAGETTEEIGKVEEPAAPKNEPAKDCQIENEGIKGTVTKGKTRIRRAVVKKLSKYEEIKQRLMNSQQYRGMEPENLEKSIRQIEMLESKYPGFRFDPQNPSPPLTQFFAYADKVGIKLNMPIDIGVSATISGISSINFDSWETEIGSLTIDLYLGNIEAYYYHATLDPSLIGIPFQAGIFMDKNLKIQGIIIRFGYSIPKPSIFSFGGKMP